MPSNNHFPIPSQRSGIDINQIIYPYGRRLSDAEEEFHHIRRLSHDVQLQRSQYFIIEKELVHTFDYGYPCVQQIHVYSPKYALIIRDACNMFESTSREIYNKIYDVAQLDIFNYLALDVLLDFNNIKLESPILESEFPICSSNILKPFTELLWNKTVAITSSQIPSWWKAYNRLKHEPDHFSDAATLENAIRSVAATAILLYKIYGAGVTLGKMPWYLTLPSGKKGHYFVDTPQSQLFMVDDGRQVWCY